MRPTSSTEDFETFESSAIDGFDSAATFPNKITGINNIPSVQKSQSSPAMATVSKPSVFGADRLPFRLNKLFAPAKDLGSVLTTCNYTLYLLAYIDAKSSPLRHKTLSFVAHHLVKSAAMEGVHHHAEASPFARLASVVSNARATLRLFGLLSIYVKARELFSAGSGMDHVLRTVGLVQCGLYGTFQLLENIAFLTDNGVLAKRLTSYWTNHGRATAIYRLAHRAWFLGVMCDFVRLVREAQLFFWRSHVEKKELGEEDAKKAAQWYYDWIKPLAWLPIGWQLGNFSEGGVPGFNMGLQGVAGVLADLRRTSELWDATGEIAA